MPPRKMPVWDGRRYNPADPLAGETELAAWLCSHGVPIYVSVSVQVRPPGSTTESVPARPRYACEEIDLPKLLAGLRDLQQAAHAQGVEDAL